MEERFLPWWKKHSARYQALLLDIDGTLKTLSRGLPGAGETLAWLRQHHYPFCLLTNDGNRSPEEKRALLARAGLEVAEGEIVSCGMALDVWGQDPAWQNRLFFVAGDLGTPSYAETAGLRITADPGKLAECVGVIIGEGMYDWRVVLSAVFNAFLQDPGKLLMVPNPDSYWPSGLNGEVGIGAGGKARFLATLLAEAGVKVSPIYLGKPHQAIFQRALDQVCRIFGLPNLPKEQVVMVGDSLKSDILGANHAGMVSALVLSGITDRATAASASGAEKPDLVFNSL